METERGSDRFTPLQAIALLCLLIVALAARLYGISSESIWFDECITYTFLDSPTIVEFYRGEAIHDPATVPIYYGSAYLWYNLGFTSIVAVRSLSVIYGMATVLVVYLFGRRLFGHIGGFTAAACVSFAKIHIYMSQEIRNYALTILLTVIAMYALYEATQSNKRNWWVVNIVATVLVGLTHFFGLLLPFAQGIYLLITRPKKLPWIALWGIVQLPFYALIPVWTRFVQSGDTVKETAWITWTPFSRVFSTYFYVYAGSLQDAMDTIRRRPWGLPVEQVLGGLLMLAGIVFVLYCAHAVWKKREVCGGYRLEPALLLLAWLFVPPATLFLLSRLVQPCYIERYVLYSSPALYLIVGGSVALLPKRSLQYAAVALLALVYAGNLYDYNRPLRHDYQNTGAILRDAYAPGEHVFSCIDFVQKPLKYYAGVPNEAIVGDRESFVDQAVAEVRGGKRAWVWFIEVPDVWEIEKIDSQLQSGEFEVQHWVFKGRWNTHLYQIAPKKIADPWA